MIENRLCLIFDKLLEGANVLVTGNFDWKNILRSISQDLAKKLKEVRVRHYRWVSTVRQ